MNYGIRPLSQTYAPMPKGTFRDHLAISLPYPMRNIFDPRRIPGLESWWDASDSASVTLDGGRVSQLSDKSGKNRHLTNTTSGSTQPSYVARARNGLNVLRFVSASNQRLFVPNSLATYKFLHNGTPSFFISVVSYGTSDNPNTFYTNFDSGPTFGQTGILFGFDDSASNATNNSLAFGVNSGLGSVASAYNGSIYPASVQNLITPQVLNVFDMLLDVGNATPANRAIFRVNGGSDITFNTRSTTPGNQDAGFNFTVGTTGVFTNGLTGDICELMLFSQQPTAAARDLIRRYLGAKWGVTLG
jgi:hypothetical protein